MTDGRRSALCLLESDPSTFLVPFGLEAKAPLFEFSLFRTLSSTHIHCVRNLFLYPSGLLPFLSRQFWLLHLVQPCSVSSFLVHQPGLDLYSFTTTLLQKLCSWFSCLPSALIVFLLPESSLLPAYMIPSVFLNGLSASAVALYKIFSTEYPE